MDFVEIDQNTVGIMPFYLKKKYLQKASINHTMIHGKIYDLENFIKEYRGEYDPFTLYEIMKGEKVSPSLAHLYLSYLGEIEEKEYASSKIQFLKKIKNKIDVQKRYHRNPFLEDFLQDKTILIYGYPLFSSKEKHFFDGLEKKYTIQKREEPLLRKEVIYRKYKTTEEEISCVAEEMTMLLQEGYSIDSLKLYLPNSSYRKEVERIFHHFHLPVELKEEKSLSVYDMTQYFLSLLHSTDLLESLEIVRETYDLSKPFLHKLYQKIMEVVEPFLEIPKEDQIPLFTYLFQNKTLSKKEYTHCIEEISTLEEAGNAIVFALGVSMGSYPKIVKEDDFLNEEEKKQLYLPPAAEKNQLAKEEAFISTQFPSKLFLSFASHSPFAEYAESPLISLLRERGLLLEEERKYSFTSRFYNQYLYTKERDRYRKYGSKTSLLETLSSLTDEETPYTHSYQTLPVDKLHTYLNHSLILSYSSIDLYYRCPFRFYLSHILKIREKVETTSTLIGNMVHKVLYLLLKENSEVEKIIDRVFAEFYTEELSPKEEFYKQKYRKEIEKLVTILQKQRSQTEFKEKYLEEEFSIERGEKCRVIVKGYIDKVLTFTDASKTYALIVDYKTGTIETNFNHVIHGLGMQLLLYYYLLKQRHNDYELGGVYWQNIMKEVLPAEKGKSYDALLESAYQWNGYTRKDAEMMKHLDLDLDMSFIKSMKMKKDGDFYYYAKVLDPVEFEKLITLTEEKMNQAIEDIEKASFPIRPKRIGYEKASDCTGCKYCPYQDICYKDPADMQRVPEYKNLDFLKEVANG